MWIIIVLILLAQKTTSPGCYPMLTRANERVHVHNARNFPQAKLDSEINVPFLFNENGDLYFLSHKNSAHIILFNLKKNYKILSEGKKDIGE